MRKLTPALVVTLLFLWACSDTMLLEDEIKTAVLTVNLDVTGPSSSVYHIYCKHNSESRLSKGIVTSNLSEQIELFPGTYTLYFYGLADKTASSKMVETYRVIHDVELFFSREISTGLNRLTPEFEYCSSGQDIILHVYMSGLYEMFTISSLSVKQASSRIKTVSREFDQLNDRYTSLIPLENPGQWFMNISYTLRSSRKDSGVLKEAGISISTSYFKSIYLGEITRENRQE